MRRSYRTALYLVFGVLFAGCGAHGGAGTGPSTSMLPSTGKALTPTFNGGNSSSTALATLYVSGQGGVYAYDISGPTPSGTVTLPAIDRDGGYYYSAGKLNASIAGIATNSHGDLIVAQNYNTTAFTGVGTCQLAYIPARTDSASPSSAQVNNCPVTGTAVSVGFTGTGTDTSGNTDMVDVLMKTSTAVASCGHSPTYSTGFEVDRYQATTSGSISLTACEVPDHGHTSGYTYNAIAGANNGQYFVDYNQTSFPNGVIERYLTFTGTTSTGSPTNTGGLPGTAGPMAVSENYSTGVGYRVVASTVGTSTTIYEFTVDKSDPNLTFTQALGTFGNHVGALAVDNSGNVYVGVNQPNGVTLVKVYPWGETQATSPTYILENAVRRPNPANPPAAVITGLAINQPNPAAPSPTIIYNSIPAVPLSSNFTSYGFDADQLSEFGSGANLATAGQLDTVSFVLKSYGCGTSGSWTNSPGPCVTTLPATFSLPITLHVYAVGGPPNYVGALLATQTQTFNIPYRPSTSPSCTGTSRPADFVDPVSGVCVPGLANEITFNVPAGVTVPSPAIFTVAFNTTSYGYAPYGTGTACHATVLGCGYDSLNVITDSSGGVSVGSYYDPNGLFQNASVARNYCSDTNPGVLRLDTGAGCWTNEQMQIQVTKR